MNNTNKKKLMSFIFSVALIMAICAVSVVSWTTAKFFTGVEMNGVTKLAGFNITQQNTSGTLTLSADGEVAQIGQSSTAQINFSYFAQTNTKFSLLNDNVQIEGIGKLEDFSTLRDNYSVWLAEKTAIGLYSGEDTTAPDSLQNMFEIKSGEIDDLAQACAEAVRTTGSLGGSGYVVNAMANNATQSINCTVNIEITWISVNNAWDSYIGSVVAQGLNETEPVLSGVSVSCVIIVEQYNAHTVTFVKDSECGYSENLVLTVEDGTLLKDIYPSDYRYSCCLSSYFINGVEEGLADEISSSTYTITEDITISLEHSKEAH